MSSFADQTSGGDGSKAASDLAGLPLGRPHHVVPLTLPQLERAAARFGTPFQLYDEGAIRANARALIAAFTAHFPGFRQQFAVKALPNPAILRALMDEGCGLDCSSTSELHIAAKLGCAGDHVCFTSNFTSREDLRIAAEQGVTINLDDVSLVPELARATADGAGFPSLISFRLNPGVGRTDSKTLSNVLGGPNAKFGVAHFQIVEAYRQAIACGATCSSLASRPTPSQRTAAHQAAEEPLAQRARLPATHTSNRSVRRYSPLEGSCAANEAPALRGGRRGAGGSSHTICVAEARRWPGVLRSLPPVSCTTSTREHSSGCSEGTQGPAHEAPQEGPGPTRRTSFWLPSVAKPLPARYSRVPPLTEAWQKLWRQAPLAPGTGASSEAEIRNGGEEAGCEAAAAQSSHNVADRANAVGMTRDAPIAEAEAEAEAGPLLHASVT